MFSFFLLNLVTIIFIVSIAGLVVAIALDARNKKRPEAVEFAHGQTPEPLPKGEWQGSHFGWLGKNWQGKVFTGDGTGYNIFRSGQKFNFRFMVDHGLNNHALKVVRLDYNQGGNPLLVRWLIKDELIQTSPGQLLGKIQFCLPGEALTLGYFRLEQSKA